MFFDNIRIKQDCYLNLIVNLPGRLSISTFWFVISVSYTHLTLPTKLEV